LLLLYILMHVFDKNFVSTISNFLLTRNIFIEHDSPTLCCAYHIRKLLFTFCDSELYIIQPDILLLYEFLVIIFMVKYVFNITPSLCTSPKWPLLSEFLNMVVCISLMRVIHPKHFFLHNLMTTIRESIW
jgi:hypothetical protein